MLHRFTGDIAGQLASQNPFLYDAWKLLVSESSLDPLQGDNPCRVYLSDWQFTAHPNTIEKLDFEQTEFTAWRSIPNYDPPRALETLGRMAERLRHQFEEAFRNPKGWTCTGGTFDLESLKESGTMAAKEDSEIMKVIGDISKALCKSKASDEVRKIVKENELLFPRRNRHPYTGIDTIIFYTDLHPDDILGLSLFYDNPKFGLASPPLIIFTITDNPTENNIRLQARKLVTLAGAVGGDCLDDLIIIRQVGITDEEFIVKEVKHQQSEAGLQPKVEEVSLEHKPKDGGISTTFKLKENRNRLEVKGDTFPNPLGLEEGAYLISMKTEKRKNGEVVSRLERMEHQLDKRVTLTFQNPSILDAVGKIGKKLDTLGLIKWMFAAPGENKISSLLQALQQDWDKWNNIADRSMVHIFSSSSFLKVRIASTGQR